MDYSPIEVSYLMAKKKRAPFGGYEINFKGQTATLEDVFGKKDISPAEMTKTLWAYIKRRRLSKRK